MMGVVDVADTDCSAHSPVPVVLPLKQKGRAEALVAGIGHCLDLDQCVHHSCPLALRAAAVVFAQKVPASK